MQILNNIYLTCYKICYLVIITCLYNGGRGSHSKQNESIALDLFRKNLTYTIPVAQINTDTQTHTEKNHQQTNKQKKGR